MSIQDEFKPRSVDCTSLGSFDLDPENKVAVVLNNKVHSCAISNFAYLYYEIVFPFNRTHQSSCFSMAKCKLVKN